MRSLLIAIVGIIIFTVISKCSHQNKENKTEIIEDRQVIENTSKIDSLETVANDLQTKLTNTHLKDSLSKIASNRLIKYWKNKALKSRGRIDTLILKDPFVKDAFEDQDSLLASIEIRNNDLENEKLKQWNDFNKILSISEEQLTLQQETTAIISEQRNGYKKKAAKRYSVGPFIGIDYKLHPTFGVSVQYRLLRF